MIDLNFEKLIELNWKPEIRQKDSEAMLRGGKVSKAPPSPDAGSVSTEHLWDFEKGFASFDK
jgi:hypothetical protein